MRKTVLIMWAAYALGSAGGMTVASHVTGIVVSFAGSTTQAVGTVASCAMGNWCGRILAGVGSDVFGPKAVIVAGALGASAILATLQCFFQGNAVAAQIGLTLLGLCFGATLTAYPVLVRRMVRARLHHRIHPPSPSQLYRACIVRSCATHALPSMHCSRHVGPMFDEDRNITNPRRSGPSRSGCGSGRSSRALACRLF